MVVSELKTDEVGEELNVGISRFGISKARPACMKDYVCENRGMVIEDYSEEWLHCLSPEDDPDTFEVAVTGR